MATATTLTSAREDGDVASARQGEMEMVAAASVRRDGDGGDD